MRLAGRYGAPAPDPFAAGNLTQPYRSINTDVNKRICYLEPEENGPAVAT